MRRARWLRRPETVWLLAALAGALTLVSAYLTADHLSEDAHRASELYARVFTGLGDSSEYGATDALFGLATQIRRQGIPLVVTDQHGVPTDTANLPAPMAFDSPALRAFVVSLDRDNPPLTEISGRTVHVGALPVRARLRLIFVLELATVAGLAGVAVLAHRASVRAARDRVWVAMARESAHQLGTPLTSLAGWIDRLRDGADRRDEIAWHLAGDYERLDRVARRFERIGQPPRRDNVDVAAVADAVGSYFRPRLPTLAHRIALEVRSDGTPAGVEGDALLLEWALEALVRNAVDALKGRGGTIEVAVASEPDGVVVTVTDDGPGVARELRHRLFTAGATTKEGGWGLGLALARRVVEEGHGGRLVLEPSEAGARFALHLPRELPAG
ncbi:MAG TPA: HAMP domain-containing sensor histidine kinase [Gemmatimonadales bacterium]|nr:HAMP domain-containing sensor histidine kinase [Gemmatimonadales bacterium]